ncbi:hypothetical protein CC1G_13907 [Coprinopsis cinerea okayama7|uniref:Uncharacterized protein n=1 Tax=Coprinopsis cinerea (strain Okayama-7 / 130 / ATCC MYA-4618 / FGSC 9003) TaxID=240176 RepID=D6RKX5_COPC7|nr:hypothetical protein CC1G_13907 [Coprinopsis cinerea okayama7\|eukprot:XP_002911867.1 hypothetical protein CC1G_13907 [Coprinopsis cinerea okayama7\
MDAFDGELSDVEESQATQLLLDIVPRKSPSPGLPSKGSSKPTAVQPAGADISVDSHNSSRISTSIPTYHFHGLATTQTETDLTMEDHNGGSQKENIQAPVGAAEIQQVEGGSRAVQGQATPSISKSGHNKASHSVSHSKDTERETYRTVFSTITVKLGETVAQVLDAPETQQLGGIIKSKAYKVPDPS